MSSILPLSRWLSGPRPADWPVAWQADRLWTQGQLRQQVAALVQRLAAAPQSRWALCFDDHYLFLVALLACLHAGKRPVIPGHSRLAQLQEQASLFDGLLSDQPLGGPWAFVPVTGDEPSVPAADALPPLAQDARVALFTSGSTGLPKVVEKPVASLEAEAQQLIAHLGPRLDDSHFVASVVPQHLYGLTFGIVLPMTLGRPFHARMIYYAEQLAALPRDRRYAFISSPAFLKRLDPQLPPPGLSLLLSAGGQLPWPHAQQAQAWCGRPVDEIYGSTETGILAWRQRQAEESPWYPFPAVAWQAEADGWRVRSPWLADPAGWPLEDRLHWLAPDRFALLGRHGRIVKIEDKRVSLSEVEQRLLGLDGVQEAAVLPISRAGRQGIGALLVMSPEAKLAWQQASSAGQELAWRRALRRYLEPVAIPRLWRVVDAIPVNSMNKRVMAQLQELLDETP